MLKIVISYRRDDSDAIAGRIRDRLVNHYGSDSVFMDIDNIPIGENFRDYIAEALAKTDAMLVIVGPRWVGGTKSKPRIRNANDPVRVELEKAFELGIRMVPVLVHDAEMPNEQTLPESVRQFADLNAAYIETGRDFHAHVDRLIRALDRLIGKVTPAVQQEKGSADTAGSPASSPKGPMKKFALGLAGLAIVAMGAGGWFVYSWKAGSPSKAGPPERAQTEALRQPGSVNCREEKNLHSLETAQPTSISFLNKSKGTKRIFWLNHTADRVQYATLEADQSMSQPTYVGHPWMVANSAGECEAIYMPTPDRLSITINR